LLLDLPRQSKSSKPAYRNWGLLIAGFILLTPFTPG
jgi:hypothetical protein